MYVNEEKNLNPKKAYKERRKKLRKSSTVRNYRVRTVGGKSEYVGKHCSMYQWTEVVWLNGIDG